MRRDVALHAAGRCRSVGQSDSGHLRCREDALGHETGTGDQLVALQRIVSRETPLVGSHRRELRIAGCIPGGVALRRDPATRPGGGPHWTNVQ
jgi:hypothetical protein